VKRHGFTYVEVVIALSIMAGMIFIAVGIPRQRLRGEQEHQLRMILGNTRQAIAAFQRDTGLTPLSLADLAARNAPATGRSPSAPIPVSIDPQLWRGPYLLQLPNDPVSGLPLVYSAGNVSSSSSGNDSKGTAFSTY
jgi:type II secretory pathway pseudopilin PulG